MSARPTYRKSPAVMAEIHSVATLSVETDRAMYSPMKEVRELPTFSIKAFLTDTPQCNKIAKSPETKPQRCSQTK